MAENESYDSFWPALQPDGYADYRDDQEGEWKYLLEGDTPIAVVWTNWDDGTGIMWAKTTPTVLDIFKKLVVMKKMGESAAGAYGMLDTIQETKFSEPSTGKLSDAGSAFEKLVDSNE